LDPTFFLLDTTFKAAVFFTCLCNAQEFWSDDENCAVASAALLQQLIPRLGDVAKATLSYDIS
jgi:hypothetical protein